MPNQILLADFVRDWLQEVSVGGIKKIELGQFTLMSQQIKVNLGVLFG